ncbi:MAG: hypothetical protein KJZ70_05890 [Bryobacterales bacterium]|nr:hypothetical protein [Bryobacterales bacterium]
MKEIAPPQSGGSAPRNPLPASAPSGFEERSSPDPGSSENMLAEEPESVSRRLATELLDAVDSGSSAALLEILSRIAFVDAETADLGETDAGEEREKLELLRALAVQMRLDLHSMLMHIYQRIEASRGYLEIARHLAGRAPGSGSDLGNALPRVGSRAGLDWKGRELGASEQCGEI